jgi:hypothetical protein
LNQRLADEEVLVIIRRSVPHWNESLIRSAQSVTTIQALTTYYQDLEELAISRQHRNRRREAQSGNRNPGRARGERKEHRYQRENNYHQVARGTENRVEPNNSIENTNNAYCQNNNQNYGNRCGGPYRNNSNNNNQSNNNNNQQNNDNHNKNRRHQYNLRPRQEENHRINSYDESRGSASHSINSENSNQSKKSNQSNHSENSGNTYHHETYNVDTNQPNNNNEYIAHQEVDYHPDVVLSVLQSAATKHKKVVRAFSRHW